MHEPSVTLATEWSLLLTACSQISPEEKAERIRAHLQKPINWKALCHLADHHGVRPLLYQSLDAIETDVPREELRVLQRLHQTNVHKTLFLSRELIRIVEHLSAQGLEILPYKGLALAEAVYGDIALRQAGDIDLLIRPQDFARVRDAVADLGYTAQTSLPAAQERAYLKSGYECAFDGTAGRNLLEVQWALQPRFYAVDFDMEGLFRRAVTIDVAGHSMKTPSSEDLFIVLALHAAKHVWGRLVWLCDLERIMSAPTLDWNWIGPQARRLGIVRILRVTMMLARDMLGAVIPVAAERNLPSDSAEHVLAKEIEPHITSAMTYNVESPAYFRLMMRLRERRGDRLRFLHRLTFTPGPSEWQAVRLPTALFPLYRLVRVSRLAARLLRS